MDRDEIIDCIKTLGMSQGMYSRIYNNLMQMKEYNPEQYDSTMTMLEDKNFEDALDLVMFIEG